MIKRGTLDRILIVGVLIILIFGCIYFYISFQREHKIDFTFSDTEVEEIVMQNWTSVSEYQSVEIQDRDDIKLITDEILTIRGTIDPMYTDDQPEKLMITFYLYDGTEYSVIYYPGIIAHGRVEWTGHEEELESPVDLMKLWKQYQ